MLEGLGGCVTLKDIVLWFSFTRLASHCRPLVVLPHSFRTCFCSCIFRCHSACRGDVADSVFICFCPTSVNTPLRDYSASVLRWSTRSLPQGGSPRRQPHSIKWKLSWNRCIVWSNKLKHPHVLPICQSMADTNPALCLQSVTKAGTIQANNSPSATEDGSLWQLQHSPGSQSPW